MLSTNVTQFRKNLFHYVNQAVEFNQVISITAKNGAAILLSQDDYNSLMETAYLLAHPATALDIRAGLATPWDECVPESEVDWS